MKTHEAGRPPISVQLAAVLLVLFSLSGMLAGSLTRVTTSPSMLASLLGQSANSSATHSTSSPTSANQAAPTSTPPPTRTITGTFTLSAEVSPQSVRPGSKVIITVTAHDAAGALLSGLPVHLGPPHGGVGLLTTWPTASATNASGIVTWTLIVPATATPGQYVVAAFGDGANYHFYSEHYVNVTA